MFSEQSQVQHDAINMMKETGKEQATHASFEAFQKCLPDLMARHAGKFALIRSGRIVEFFDTPRDALIFARVQYKDDLYCVQETTGQVADPGWLTRFGGAVTSGRKCLHGQ